MAAKNKTPQKKTTKYNAEKIIKEWFIYHFSETMQKMDEGHEAEHKDENIEAALYSCYNTQLLLLGCLNEIYCAGHKRADIDSVVFAKWLGFKDDDSLELFIDFAEFLIHLRDDHCECEECKKEAEEAMKETPKENLN